MNHSIQGVTKGCCIIKYKFENELVLIFEKNNLKQCLQLLHTTFKWRKNILKDLALHLYALEHTITSFLFSKYLLPSANYSSLISNNNRYIIQSQTNDLLHKKIFLVFRFPLNMYNKHASIMSPLKRYSSHINTLKKMLLNKINLSKTKHNVHEHNKEQSTEEYHED